MYRYPRFRGDRSNITSTDPNPTTTINVPASVGFTDPARGNFVLDMQPTVLVDTIGYPYPVTFGAPGQMMGPEVMVRNFSVTAAGKFLNGETNAGITNITPDWYQRTRALESARSSVGASVNKNYGSGWVDRLPTSPFVSYANARPSDNNVVVDYSVAGQQPISMRAQVKADMHMVDEFANGMRVLPNLALGGDLQYKIDFALPTMSTLSLAEMPTCCETIQARASVGTLLGNATAQLTTQRNVSQFTRPPLVGDRVFLACRDATPINRDGTDVITAVTEAGSKYVITLATGITTANNSACTGIVLWYGSGSRLRTAYESANVTPVGNNIGIAGAPFVITNFYDTNGGSASNIDYDMCPFVTGFPILVWAYNTVANTVFNASTTIQSLTRVGRDLQIILAGTGVAVGTNDPCIVYFAHRDFNTDGNAPICASTTTFPITWTLYDTYIDACQVNMMPDQVNQIRQQLQSGVKFDFISKMQIPRQVAASTNMDTDIMLPPRCVGLAVLTPQNNSVVSGFDNCTSYVFDIGTDMWTPRFIPVGQINSADRQLQNYVLKLFFKAIGSNLAKYDAATRDNDHVQPTVDKGMYVCVPPYSKESQHVRLRLFSSTAMAQKTQYWIPYVRKTLVVSKDGVAVI